MVFSYNDPRKPARLPDEPLSGDVDLALDLRERRPQSWSHLQRMLLRAGGLDRLPGRECPPQMKLVGGNPGKEDERTQPMIGVGRDQGVRGPERLKEEGALSRREKLACDISRDQTGPWLDPRPTVRAIPAVIHLVTGSRERVEGEEKTLHALWRHSLKVLPRMEDFLLYYL